MKVRSIGAFVAICVLGFLAPDAGASRELSGSGDRNPQMIGLPGTTFSIETDRAVRDGDAVDAGLLNAIGMWLSEHFKLPPAKPSKIEFVTNETMRTLRYKPFVSDPSTFSANLSTVVAVYVDQSQTIYLPAEWTGRTPAELSVLVHEMVHHLQNAAAMRFDCPEAREKIAYKAQREWLELYGEDFFAAFETDPFTLLARTSCPM